jgi:hypothetical protein
MLSSIIEGKDLPTDLEKIPEDFDKIIVAEYLSQGWTHPILNEFFQSKNVDIPKMNETLTSYPLWSIYYARPEQGTLMDFWNQLIGSVCNIRQNIHQHLSGVFQKTILGHDDKVHGLMIQPMTSQKSHFSFVRIDYISTYPIL